MILDSYKKIGVNIRYKPKWRGRIFSHGRNSGHGQSNSWDRKPLEGPMKSHRYKKGDRA